MLWLRVSIGFVSSALPLGTGEGYRGSMSKMTTITHNKAKIIQYNQDHSPHPVVLKHLNSLSLVARLLQNI